MKKHIIAILLLAIGLLSCPVMAFGADNVQVMVDGEEQDMLLSVYEIDNTVLVPIRPIFELFHYKVEWDNMRHRITTSTAIGKLKIQLGSVLVSQNNYQPYVLSTYPRLIEGRTVIPIEFASACTDSSIKYIETLNTITINTK